MKLSSIKFIVVFSFLILGNTLILSQSIKYCIANPHPFNIDQSDGSKLIVRIVGDEKYSQMQTEDGYTVLKNDLGFYEYAMMSKDKKLIRSGIKAKMPKDRNEEEKRSLLKFKNDIIESGQFTTEHENAILSGQNLSTISASFQRTGTHRLLVILIDFTGNPSSINAQTFNNLMNQPDYNSTGSFRDYWLVNSYNTLTVNSTVVGWYHAPDSMSTYGAPVIVNGEERTHDNNPRLLVQQAIDAAENAGVDFSEFDNNHDGVMDGLLIVHSGQGQENFGSFPNATMTQANNIWSHRSTLESFSRVYDGVTINDYALVPELNFFNNINTIGVICHEFGHIIGLPDLYDTDQDSQGIGNWDLMASGNWNNWGETPSNLSAWSKMYLGWLSPYTVPAGNFNLPNSTQNSTVYRINTPNSGEYFLLENRQHVGFDGALPGTGLAIWHINTNKTSAAHIAANDVNKDKNAKGVDLEEADGLNDLDLNVNRGDNGDLFPGNSCNNLFSDLTNPNSKTYSPIVNINKPITNIVESNNQVFFSYLNSPPISGPMMACIGGATFTYNAPSNNITWHKSDNLVFVGDNTGSSVIVAPVSEETNGMGWVYAVVNTTCGDRTLSQRNIWLGVPPLESISGPGYGVQNEVLYYNVNPEEELRAYTTYNWYIEGYENSYILNSSYGYANVSFFDPNNYYLKVQATNECGSSWAMAPIEIYYQYILSPNPAKSEVTITVDSKEPLLNNTFSVSIYDSYGNLKKKSKFFGAKFTIPLDNLPNGHYVVKIDNGKKTSTHQLIIGN